MNLVFIWVALSNSNQLSSVQFERFWQYKHWFFIQTLIYFTRLNRCEAERWWSSQAGVWSTQCPHRLLSITSHNPLSLRVLCPPDSSFLSFLAWSSSLSLIFFLSISQSQPAPLKHLAHFRSSGSLCCHITHTHTHTHTHTKEMASYKSTKKHQSITLHASQICVFKKARCRGTLADSITSEETFPFQCWCIRLIVWYSGSDGASNTLQGSLQSNKSETQSCSLCASILSLCVCFQFNHIAQA